MPTKSEIMDLLDQLNLDYKESMTKAKLLQILGDKADQLEYVNEPSMDLMSKKIKGIMIKGIKFEKLWAKELPNMFVSVLASSKGDTLLVKGSQSGGKGLGKGGAKWVWQTSKVL